MNLSSHLAALKDSGKRALTCFFTAGDQPLSDLHPIIEALAEGGCDLVEIGIPFSDPYGEGVTIQESSFRSLQNGTSTGLILEEVSKRSTAIPAIVMGYTNQALRMGWGQYASSLQASGLLGAILSDLVPDEAGEWIESAGASGVDTIFLAAPTSTDRRIEQVATHSTGFVYAISRTGVTGAENEVPVQVDELVARLKSHTSKPIYVGFGISKPEHVARVCKVADGAIVGSKIVQLLHEEWNNGNGVEKVVHAVRNLKSGIS